MHKSFDLRRGARRDTGENDANNALSAANGARITPGASRLAGMNILVAEDEALVAMTLIDLVEDCGAKPIGPFAKVSECRNALECEKPDIAILDVRLRDGESFEIAEKLVERGVPVVFHSGHMIETEWLGDGDIVRFCGKPCAPAKLTEVLEDVLAR
ncbi:MAG: response regulator [Alteripontixanthobacter sp.]